jgi:hypothetical protein
MEPNTTGLPGRLERAIEKTCTDVADGLIGALWRTLKNKVILGAAIILFSVLGIALIIWSSLVTGWAQAALLGFGTSLLIVGIVELGILGVLNRIIDPDRSPDLIRHLSGDLDEKFTKIESLLVMLQRPKPDLQGPDRTI